MINQFNFKRFLNVARWDLSVNSKFYTRSALLMVAVICMPVVLYYLYSMVMKSYLSFATIYDTAEGFATVINLIGLAYMIIASGYMFHNLLTKQGRINELTLPATNLERFIWHAVVVIVGVDVVFFAGVLTADLLHVLFRLPIPNAEQKHVWSDCVLLLDGALLRPQLQPRQRLEVPLQHSSHLLHLFPHSDLPAPACAVHRHAVHLARVRLESLELAEREEHHLLDCLLGHHRCPSLRRHLAPDLSPLQAGTADHEKESVNSEAITTEVSNEHNQPQIKQIKQM